MKKKALDHKREKKRKHIKHTFPCQHIYLERQDHQTSTQAQRTCGTAFVEVPTPSQ